MKLRRSLSAFCLVIYSLTAGNAYAGIGPENVAVVVNGDSPSSIRIANEYARLREIPTSHFIVLHHVSGTEFIDVDHFRDEILRPTLETLRLRGLTAQVDCITYSTDLPYSINVGSDIKGRPMPMVITQQASINGLTYLYDWVLKGDIDYLRLDINRYARRIMPLPKGKDLTSAEQADYAIALNEYAKKNYPPAIQGLIKLLESPRTDPNIAYNLACCQALNGDPDAAIKSLRLAIRAGWRNYGQTTSDPDLASLTKIQEYQQVLRVLQHSDIQVQPGVPFGSQRAWNPSGASDSSGQHYMLSTVLGVTAGRGNSEDEVLKYLQRSQLADFTSPKGTIYFERNGDVRSKTREWGFQPAADELKKLGVNAIVEDGVLPQNRSDVAGATIGAAGFDWPASHSAISPGAILEHLTSFGGVLSKGADQTPCTEFMRYGASGSSGTVTEPYALQEKFPTPFIHVQYAKGFTLAESFYLSLTGPYQLLILGDPLCRPWAKPVKVSVTGLPANLQLNATVKLHLAVTGAAPVTRYQLFSDGKWLKDYKSSEPVSLDPQSLGYGYHQLTVVAEIADAPLSKYTTTTAIWIPSAKYKIEAPTKLKALFTGSIMIPVTAKGASSIEIFHLGRSIGSLKSDRGLVAIASSDIGDNACSLTPVATYQVSGRAVMVQGAPISITSIRS